MVENSETHIIAIFILVMSLVCVGAVVVMLVMPKRDKQDKMRLKHNIQESKKYILDVLLNREIRHQYHDFDSGCCMIDVWKNDKFYCIQVDHESIGVSLVEGDDGFSTTPDEIFFDFRKFSEKLDDILKA